MAYGHGRLFYDYIVANTDHEALARAVDQLRAEGNDPKEAMILAGSASIQRDRDGLNVREICAIDEKGAP